jgi:hypothetical protein
MTSRAPSIRLCVVIALVTSLLTTTAPAFAQEAAASQPPKPQGASWAEKVAFAWLLGGGIVLAYYGPKEIENDELTRDGRSEAIAGWVSIGISVALLHDILTKRKASRNAPRAGAPGSSSQTAK